MFLLISDPSPGQQSLTQFRWHCLKKRQIGQDLIRAVVSAEDTCLSGSPAASTQPRQFTRLTWGTIPERRKAKHQARNEINTKTIFRDCGFIVGLPTRSVRARDRETDST